MVVQNSNTHVRGKCILKLFMGLRSLQFSTTFRYTNSVFQQLDIPKCKCYFLKNSYPQPQFNPKIN